MLRLGGTGTLGLIAYLHCRPGSRILIFGAEKPAEFGETEKAAGGYEGKSDMKCAI